VPLHRNECAQCGCEFRVLELPGTEDGAVCPACGGRNVRRLLPHVALQFRGSGFYRTDHARSRRGGGNGSEPPKESEPSPAATASEN
jgi:putative FmdB family regulatory protein